MKPKTYNKFTEDEKWTESDVKAIFGEDDRYEFKSGKLFNEDEKIIKAKIAKEICALVNSFGGTLFVGVDDKSLEIEGVRALYKGRQSTIGWLENVIPNLLTFRIPYFRISEVELTQKTNDAIGSDNTLIAVDVFDSSLAPHQVTESKTYYYRENSSSVVAPHSYLAYLWSRNSQNMSEVVRSWFVNYLNPLIVHLGKVSILLSDLDFSAKDRPKEYFNLVFWNSLNSELSAQQFLRMFPEIKKKIDLISENAQNSKSTFSKLQDKIINSTELDKKLRDICNKFYLRDHYEAYNPNGKSFDEVLLIVYNELRTGNSHNAEIVKLKLTKNIIDSRLGIIHRDSNDSPLAFYQWCKSVLSNEVNNPSINTTFVSFKKQLNAVKDTSLHLLNDLEELRFELALKHNTTYF